MLKESLDRILKDYNSATAEDFAKHPLANFIRQDLPRSISEVVAEPARFIVKGSAGQGNWNRCPWISIFDISITDSAQSGYYPVYLFREDMTGVYLSLNQGITSVRKKYKADTKDVLKITAADFRAQIGALPDRFRDVGIDLRPSTTSNDSAFYEAGNICARFYERNAIPSESELVADLKTLVGVYKALVDNDDREGEEDDLPPSKGIEDLTKLKTHKRVERNRKLAKEAKKYHGYTCQACGFNFQNTYGLIGENYIEAHHLRSLWMIKGEKVELDPKNDFRVLCPNCHRMIHRTEDPGDLESFKKLIKE